MMRLTLICHTKKLPAPILAGLAEYRKRLSKTAPFSWQLDQSDSIASDASDSITVWMDRRGQSVSSPELANLIRGWMLDGKSQLRFMLGYPNVQRSMQSPDYCLSLSPLSLSTSVAALLTAEQIYRAFRILDNQPYHK